MTVCLFISNHWSHLAVSRHSKPLLPFHRCPGSRAGRSTVKMVMPQAPHCWRLWMPSSLPHAPLTSPSACLCRMSTRLEVRAVLVWVAVRVIEVFCCKLKTFECSNYQVYYILKVFWEWEHLVTKTAELNKVWKEFPLVLFLLKCVCSFRALCYWNHRACHWSSNC